MTKNDKYEPGNPEYDYWNDKNLYPDLRHDDEISPSSQQNAAQNDSKVSAGSIFLVVFIWLLILAPFALFFTWSDWIVQVVFWVGAMAIILVFIAWFYRIIKEDRDKKNPPSKPENDPNLPWYKKYPPADVVAPQKKK